jgi:hypothetical protein
VIGWRRLHDEPSDGEAYIYALAAGAAIWLGSYLWKKYNKPNKKLPPLDDKRDD